MKLVIVGGGAGGPAAATRARRLDEKAEIVLLEKGEHVSYAHCGLPYYTGGVIKDRNNMLVSTPQELAARYRIDVRLHHQVKAIKPKTKQLEVADLIKNVRSASSADSASGNVRRAPSGIISRYARRHLSILKSAWALMSVPRSAP